MTLSAIASRRNLSWLASRTAASISPRNASIVSTSMWFVGSSSRRTSLSFAFARARAVRTLDFSPPEREPNRWSRSSSPTPRSLRIGSFTITLSLRAAPPGDVAGFVPGHARAGVRGVPGVRAGHPRLEAGELRLDPLRLRARGGEDVPHDGLRRDVRDLREVAVPEAGLEHEVSQVRRRLAREDPEQGAFPRAVRADEGDLVPRVEEEVGMLQHERGAPGF